MKSNTSSMTTLSQFGMGAAPTEVEPEEVTESEEDEDLDASEETDEEIDTEGEDQEDEEEDEDEESLGGSKDFKRLYTQKEREARKLQSEKDSQAAVVQQQQAQLLALIDKHNALMEEVEKIKNNTDEEDLFDGDDDEFLTRKDLKALNKKKEGSSASAEKLAQERIAQQEQQRLYMQNQWVSARPDYQDVVKYVNDKNLAKDPEFANLTTDTVGAYWAVKACMLEDRLKTVAKKKKPKKPVPPVGGRGGGMVNKATVKKNAQSISDFFEKIRI
jgi:hypothetical protein